MKMLVEIDTEVEVVVPKRLVLHGPSSLAGAMLRSPQPAPVRPMTEEQIRAMCSHDWVFDTVKQWVRITEAHHGIRSEGA
jgi:hypothetical protein